MKVETGLETVMKQQIEVVEKLATAVRLNNALLLAQSMGLDFTQGIDATKTLRYLAQVERYIRGDKNG